MTHKQCAFDLLRLILISLCFFISFLDHLCAATSIPSKTSQRSNHVLKVTYASILNCTIRPDLLVLLTHVDLVKDENEALLKITIVNMTELLLTS